MNSLANFSQLEAYVRPLVGNLLEELETREWTKPPASINLFFDKFSTPKKADELKKRVAINTKLFQTNYVIAVVLVIIFYVLTHPFSVLSFVFSAIACGSATSTYPPITLSTLHSRLPQRLATPSERMVGAVLVSSMMIFMTGALGSLFKHIVFGLIAVATHASFRQAAPVSRVEETKERLMIKS